MNLFKVGQRIKYRGLRGTVLSVAIPSRFDMKGGIPHYQVKLDNGAHATGTKHQLEAVRKV